MKTNDTTTPAQVRREIKRRGLPYDIFKAAQCWFVTEGDTTEWRDGTSLNTYNFYGQPAAWWVDIIEHMAQRHAERRARGW